MKEYFKGTCPGCDQELIGRVMRCQKLIDWWCEPEPTQKPLKDMQLEELMQVKVEEKGSIWGWLLCVLSCANYTDGFDYDWKLGVCKCRGDWRPPLWRR